MKKLLTILIFSILPYNLIADTSAELQSLKSKYDSAIKKATDPINEIYKAQLNALLAKYTNAKDLDSANLVLEQIKNTGFLTDVPVVVENKAVDFTALKHVFVKKLWKNSFGATFKFNDDGTGTRTSGKFVSSFSWKFLSDGIVELSGKDSQNGPMVTWFGDFSNKKDVKFGQDKDNFKDTLILTR